jgi:hypothetical protein
MPITNKKRVKKNSTRNNSTKKNKLRKRHTTKKDKFDSAKIHPASLILHKKC